MCSVLSITINQAKFLTLWLLLAESTSCHHASFPFAETTHYTCMCGSNQKEIKEPIDGTGIASVSHHMHSNMDHICMLMESKLPTIRHLVTKMPKFSSYLNSHMHGTIYHEIPRLIYVIF